MSRKTKEVTVQSTKYRLTQCDAETGLQLTELLLPTGMLAGGQEGFAGGVASLLAGKTRLPPGTLVALADLLFASVERLDVLRDSQGKTRVIPESLAGASWREHFAGKYPELIELAAIALRHSAGTFFQDGGSEEASPQATDQPA